MEFHDILDVIDYISILTLKVNMFIISHIKNLHSEIPKIQYAIHSTYKNIKFAKLYTFLGIVWRYTYDVHVCM